MFGAFGGRNSGELDWEGKMGLFLVPTEGPLLSLPEENVQERLPSLPNQPLPITRTSVPGLDFGEWP